jgi:hypothetical protein
MEEIMSTEADPNTLKEMIAVELENHPTSEYRSILQKFRGDFPTAWTYVVPPPADMDTAADLNESRSIEAEGMKTEAWIDLSGDHATVRLNPNYYADLPADNLREEAQRILLEWATEQRKALRIDPDVR